MRTLRNKKGKKFPSAYTNEVCPIAWAGAQNEEEFEYCSNAVRSYIGLSATRDRTECINAQEYSNCRPHFKQTW